MKKANLGSIFKNLPTLQALQENNSEQQVQQLPFIIKQINDFWYLCKTDESVPFYQIQFYCDYYGLDKSQILENLRKYQFKEFQWLSVHDYFSTTLYPDPDKKRIVYDEINKYKNKSSIAKYMMALFDKNQGAVQTIVTQQENSIALLYESLQKIMEYQFETAVELILKVFQMTGFSSNYQGLSINVKLTAFSLLLGLFDCFPERYDEIQQYLLKDTLYPGSNLVDLILSYLNQEDIGQEQDDDEGDEEIQKQKKNLILQPRIQIVNQILKRLNEVQSKKQSQYSEYLILEFNHFIKKIWQINNQNQNYQVSELPMNLSKEFNRQQCSQIIWLKLKNKISYKEALSQRELDEWRRIAYSEFYTEALVQLASYSLDNQDVMNSKKCFKILYCLGHEKYNEQLYQLEIFERNYAEAYTIAQSSEICFEKQALCLYKNGNWQQSIKLISENLLNHTRNNRTNLHCLWQLQSSLKHRSTQYSNMVSCLLANEIFKTQFVDQNQTLKYYLLCKQILCGYFFEKDLKNVRQILELIQSQVKVSNQEDQITRFFIDRKMEKVPSLKLKKNKETPHLPPLKFSQNILEILNIDRKYIKQQCMQQKELLQEQLNESLAHDEKKLLQFLIQLAKSLIFDNESLYKEKQLGFIEDKIIRKSLKNAHLINEFRNPTSMFVLDFVKMAFTSKEINNNNYFDIIKEIRTPLEKNQNLEDVTSNNGRDQDLFQYQIDPNFGIRFSGNLVGGGIPYIASCQVTLLENNQGYFNFNSQLFSVFSLTESAETIGKFDNLLKQPSPYCLNAYSYCIIGENITLLCEPFEERLFEFLTQKQIDNKNSFQDQQQKNTIRQQQREEQESKEVLKSLRESELKYSSEIASLQKERKQFDKQDFFITNSVFGSQPDQSQPIVQVHASQPEENKNPGEIDNLVDQKSEIEGNQLGGEKIETPRKRQKFELEETILITELIAICASLHMVGLSGFFALYADSLFFINERGELKIPNLVAMQFQKNKYLSKFALAPELFLYLVKDDIGPKADIWAIGVILYRIFWGKDIIDPSQDIVEQLMRFKKLNEVDRILALPYEEHLFFDLNIPHNKEVRVLIHDIIKKCLYFDYESRPSSIELLLQVHQYFKKAISPEGIFSLYGRVPVISYLYSLDNILFLKDRKVDEDNQDIYLIAGGNSLINLKNGVFIYITPYNTVLVIYNPLFKNKSINDQNLINLMTGQGFLQLITNGRQLSGHFSQYGQIYQVQMLDRFLKRKIKLIFDEQNTPKGSETEEKIIEDPYNKSAFLEDHAIIKKFIGIIKESQNGKQFIDFYGNLCNCNFDEYGTQMFENEDPYILIDSMKNLVVHKNKAFVFDFQTMSFSVFYEILNEEEGQTHTLLEILHKLGNSHLVKQHLLEGMKYVGSLSRWEQDEGQLFFQFSNTMRIKGRYTSLQDPYYTKICYSNNDFYEGTIIDGKYNGIGVYGNKNAKIFDGYYEDDQFKEGTIFYHGADTPFIKYVGQVKFNVEGQIYIKEGQGCLFSKNDDFYEGEFLGDKFHGQGLLKYQQNRLGYYQGMFQEGVREGYGILKDKNGNVYEGNFGRNKKEGKGKEVYVNGNVYVGDFLANKRDGEGILDYFNQEILQYEGQFKEGKKHGEGIERFRDGKKYQVKYYKDQEMRRQFIGVDKKMEEIVKIQQRLPFKTYSFI